MDLNLLQKILAGDLADADLLYVLKGAGETGLARSKALEVGQLRALIAEIVTENQPTVGLSVFVYDEKSQGTMPQMPTAGIWLMRDLNKLTGDHVELGVSLGLSALTLPAGTWEISAKAPSLRNEYHKARLYNVTAGATLLYGTAELHTKRYHIVTSSCILGRFTLATTSTVRIEHRIGLASDTLGAATSYGPEIYTQAKLTKVG